MLGNTILAKAYENMYTTFEGRSINWFKLYVSQFWQYLSKFQISKYLTKQIISWFLWYI